MPSESTLVRWPDHHHHSLVTCLRLIPLLAGKVGKLIRGVVVHSGLKMISHGRWRKYARNVITEKEEVKGGLIYKKEIYFHF